MRHGSCVRCSLFPAPGLRTGRRGGRWRQHFGGGIGAKSGRCTGTTSRMRAAGALGGGGGWRWTPRILVVLDGACAPAQPAFTPELSAIGPEQCRALGKRCDKPTSRYRSGGRRGFQPTHKPTRKSKRDRVRDEVANEPPQHSHMPSRFVTLSITQCPSLRSEEHTSEL